MVPCARRITFVLNCCGDHRDLHSFPTRRSSDLGKNRTDSHSVTADLQAAIRYAYRHTWRGARVGSSVGTRSEEHTSELQSLAYLVCRLLLEKKKCVITTRVPNSLASRRQFQGPG